ncbi:hypothetical protein OG612_25665 [Streptomyces sp. NBC_01527]|uniref:hypothetical protein n=1 Tax=unclassified Streptomyces TaxID=2593676 RepID=UPI002E11AA2C|nr:hypothetical protein OG763_17985 [Streptomyces sp. NBC_01230]
MVYSATSTVYAPAQRATGLGWVTGIGRTGAVVGPWLGGAVVEGGNAGLGFTTFAAAVLGAAAICLVPPAGRTRRGATAQQTSALAGATD